MSRRAPIRPPTRAAEPTPATMGWAVALAAAILVAAAPVAPAAEPPAEARKPAGAAKATPAKAPAAALKAYVDPKTGELLSSPPPGTADVSAAAVEPAEPIVQEALPGGGVKARVPRRMMHFMRMTIAPDGSASTVCNQDHPHEARAGAAEACREK